MLLYYFIAFIVKIMYQQKSCALKCSEKLEKYGKVAMGRRFIAQFFKLILETEVFVNNDSSVPDADYVIIVDTDETIIVSSNNTDSNLHES